MKLFKSLLVAPALLGLLTPISAQSNEIDLGTISNYNQNEIDLALEIIESPWDFRDIKKLKEWFNSEHNEAKSSYIIKKVLASGLEPFKTQTPLPPIEKEDIELIVWMGIVPEKN